MYSSTAWGTSPSYTPALPWRATRRSVSARSRWTTLSTPIRGGSPLGKKTLAGSPYFWKSFMAWPIANTFCQSGR